MSSSDERIQVLTMIEEGKIDAEEGASLLKALGDSPKGFVSDPKDKRLLRVQVDDSRGGRRKVNVVLPMRLVNAGLKIANNYLDEETSEHAAALYEAIRSGETGKIVEVFEDDGEHVQIYLE
jgi:hypothetical protein